MNKIKVGDEVQITAGKDKGKRGKLLKIVTAKNGACRVIVEGANLVKKHVRPNPQLNVEGGIIQKEASLHVSNVALFDAKSGKCSKVGIKLTDDGKKVRYFKSTNEIIEQA